MTFENEAAFMRHVMAWVKKTFPSALMYHTHDSRGSQAGFPDVVFLGPFGLIFAEFKMRGPEDLTPEQARWVIRLNTQGGVRSVVWSPEDWQNGTIQRSFTHVEISPPEIRHKMQLACDQVPPADNEEEEIPDDIKFLPEPMRHRAIRAHIQAVEERRRHLGRCEGG